MNYCWEKQNKVEKNRNKSTKHVKNKNKNFFQTI